MVWTDYLRVLISLIVITNPIGAIPVFLTITSDESGEQKKLTARTAALSVAFVLIGFIFLGQPILQLFGISLASFRVGGGILILLMAISMLHARHSRSKHSSEEADEAAEKEAVGVVPLAVPLLAGPGAISTIIIYSHQARGLLDNLILVLICILTAIAAWAAFFLALPIGKFLGKTGINITMRLMGLILAAIAVEFITGGLLELLPGLK